MSNYCTWFIVRMEKRNYDSKTIKTYNRCLEWFVNFAWDDRWYKDIDNFVSSLSYHPRTVNNYLASIRLYIQYLSIQWLNTLDYRLIKFVKFVPTRVWFLSDECAGKIIEAVQDKNITDVRDRIILQFLYESWLRVSELLSIQHHEIMNDWSVVVTGKWKKQRTVFLSQKILLLTQKYKWEFEKITGKKCEYMICSHANNNIWWKMTRVGIEKIVQKRAKDVWFDNVTPHTFRHTFATSLVRKWARIDIIQWLLWHSHITTTQQYLHYVNDDLYKVQSMMFSNW